jgi:hypothetical protein
MLAGIDPWPMLAWGLGVAVISCTAAMLARKGMERRSTGRHSRGLTVTATLLATSITVTGFAMSWWGGPMAALGLIGAFTGFSDMFHGQPADGPEPA